MNKDKLFLRGVGLFAGGGLAVLSLASESVANKVGGVIFGLLVAGLCFLVTKDIDSVSPKK